MKNVCFLSCLLKLGIFYKTLPCSNRRDERLRICFIGLGRHSAFKKCVNGGHSFTELLFTSMGNLAKLAENAGGGWLPF